MQIKRNPNLIREEILDENGIRIGEISFNPSDVNIYQKFLNIAKNLGNMPTMPEKVDFSSKEGISELEESLSQLRAIFDNICEDLDNIFGAGTCKLFTGGAFDPEALNPLIEGVTPYFQKAKDNRIAKYAREIE